MSNGKLRIRKSYKLAFGINKKLRNKKLENKGYIFHISKNKYIPYWARLESYILYNFINFKLDII